MRPQAPGRDDRGMAEAACRPVTVGPLGGPIVYPFMSYRDVMVDGRIAERLTEAERVRRAHRVALAGRRRPRAARRWVSPLVVLLRITRLVSTP